MDRASHLRANEFSFEKGFQWKNKGYKTFTPGGVLENTGPQSESRTPAGSWPNLTPCHCSAVGPAARCGVRAVDAALGPVGAQSPQAARPAKDTRKDILAARATFEKAKEWL